MQVPRDVAEAMTRSAPGDMGIAAGIRYPVRMYGDVMSPEMEQPEDFVNLYRRAFKDYGARALWSMRPVEDPTPADALAITPALRTYGGMDGRRLAEHLEEVCRAAQ